MGRPHEPFGYTMGQHIDDATMNINDAFTELTNTLKRYPTNPVVWVQCIGRVLVSIKAALDSLKAAKKIFDDNKTRGGS